MGDYGDTIQWGIAATVALGIWLAVVISLTLATRSRDPEPQPAGLEFGGDEPPAVVNLLTHGWSVRNAAVSATLVDLAARDVVAFDEPTADHYTVRVVSRPGDLTPYEQQVLTLIDQLDNDAPVPFEALTTGQHSDAGKWFKRFKKAVIAEARQRGLSRNRWNIAHRVIVGVAALAPAALVAAAFVALPESSSSTQSSNNDNPVSNFLTVAAIAWFALMAAFSMVRAERDTDAGLVAAGRWLGLQENLRAGTFDEMEPTAVAIWDRYLAYAVALGVAVTTARVIPLGEESDTEAWSSVGGRWRVVRVSYRSWWPPGWGQAPIAAVFVGLYQMAIAGGLLYAAVWVANNVDSTTDVNVHDIVYSPYAAAVALVLAVLGARGLVATLLGVSDLRRHRTIEGRVLRVRRPKDKPVRWAVDDGTADEIQAFRGGAHGVISQGAMVRAEVSPRLGFVRSVTDTSEKATGTTAPAEATVDPALTAAATRVLDALDASAVGAAVGCAVRGGSTKSVLGGAFRTFAGDGVTVVVTYAPGGSATSLYQQTTGLPSFLRRQVDEVGDEAWWILWHTLAVRSGESTTVVAVRAKDRDSDERCRTAVSIARDVLNSARNASPA